MKSSGGPYRTGNVSKRTSLNAQTPQRGALGGPATSGALVAALRRCKQVMEEMHPTVCDDCVDANAAFARDLVVDDGKQRHDSALFAKDATLGRALTAG